MANRKLLTREQAITGIAWASFACAYFVLLALPDRTADPYLLLLLAVVAIVILASVSCATMLVILYRRFFAQWRGTAILIVIVTLGRLLTTRSVFSGRVELVVLVLTIDAMVTLGISLALVLWKHDAGLPLIGWVLVIFIWVVLIANRLGGNIVELLLRSMGNTSAYYLWWLDSLFCTLWWTIPLGTLSFLWHTLKLVHREIRGM